MKNTMKVEFSFDENLVKESGYTISEIHNTIKKAFEEKNILCVADTKMLSFTGGSKKDDFSNMWAIILRLTKSDWFMNFATSCIWYEDEGKWEDVLRQAKQRQN